MRMAQLLFSAALVLFLSGISSAYMNVTYLNTTVVLNTSTSARVVETLTINMSNSSVAQYLQDRQALNLTLSEWAAVLHTNLLIQHIVNPDSSISNFTLLPGPLLYSNSRTAEARLTMSYVAHNITSMMNVGPRRFEYMVDSAALNFQHAPGGESLPQNARFNILIPRGTELVAVYPAPDFPPPSFLGTYNNVTAFSWYEGEPLTKFKFSYLVTQSLQEEVVSYFNSMYKGYTQQIYLLIIILLSVTSVYVYVKVFA